MTSLAVDVVMISLTAGVVMTTYVTFRRCCYDVMSLADAVIVTSIGHGVTMSHITY